MTLQQLIMVAALIPGFVAAARTVHFIKAWQARKLPLDDAARRFDAIARAAGFAPTTDAWEMAGFAVQGFIALVAMSVLVYFSYHV